MLTTVLASVALFVPTGSAKIARAFVRFDEGIARNCRFELHSLRRFDSLREARDDRRRQRDRLDESDSVHTWRLDLS